MSGIPMNYNQLNEITNYKSPNTVHAANNDLTQFFRKYLFNKILGLFEWKIPAEWEKNYFLYNLFGRGFICVLNIPEFGTICQQCELMGFNIYYQPIKAIITNPVFSMIYREIDKDCVIIKVMFDYSSPLDIVEYYAERMAIISETADMNIFNSKLSYLFVSDNKASAEAFKKVYDKIGSGEPAVFIDKELALSPDNPRLLINDVGKNYIATELLNDLRKVENEFNTLIGVPSSTDKRERLLNAEIESNNAESQVIADLWLDNIREGVEKANKMFGLNISVKKKIGGDENARDAINDRAL